MKNSNRIDVGLCVAAVVVFSLLLASNASAQGSDPVQVLFVANGYYQQEDDILDHLNDLGCYEVTTKKDYQIYGSTDLSSYDLIIITEFAPGIGYYGLQNLENSGKSILIVEYWDFWYSYKLGLVEDDWGGYYGTDTVEVIDNEHPVTYFFGDTIQVYDPSYTIYGIPFYDIADGVTPLIYSSASFNEVAVLSDDDRQIVATGIYDTTKYTADGWKLFDTILMYLHPTGDEWTSAAEAGQALYDFGVLDVLEQISAEPGAWTEENASKEVWDRLVSGNLAHLYSNLPEIITDLLDGKKKLKTKNLEGTDILRYIYIFDPNYKSECDAWIDSIEEKEESILPGSIIYSGTEANLSPMLYFFPYDYPFNIDAGNMFNDEAKYFVVNMEMVFTWIFFGYGPVHTIESGSSMLMRKGDLYHHFSGCYLSNYSSSWWGNRASGFWNWYKYQEPMPMIEGAQYSIFLDLYKFDETEPLQIGNEKCFVRFMNMFNEGDLDTFNLEADPLQEMECPRYKSDDTIDYDWSFNCSSTIQLPAKYDKCDYGDSFLPDKMLPNAYTETVAVGASAPLENNSGSSDIIFTNPTDQDHEAHAELFPRVQLAVPGNAYLNDSDPIEKWCWEHEAICNDLGSPTNWDAFKSGNQIQDWMLEEGHYYMSQRNLQFNWWQYLAPETNHGPWRVPHITAGMKLSLMLVVREDEFYSSCSCMDSNYYQLDSMPGPAEDKPRNIACLLYWDVNGEAHIPGEDDGYADPEEFIRDFRMSPDDGSFSTEYPITKLACIHDDPFKGQVLISGTNYWNGQNAYSYKTEEVEIPSDAAGLAVVIFDGVIEKTVGSIRRQVRYFPVFIDPIADVGGQGRMVINDSALPACWIGATSRKADDPIPQVLFATFGNEFSEVWKWLIGGDIGAYARIYSGDHLGLHSFFGDVMVRWDGVKDDEVYNDGPPFSAFRYFGSNMTMYQAGETEEEKWRDGFGFVIPGAGAVQTRCPNFVPILLEDNFPWDTVRSRKGNLENGVYQSDGLEGQGIYNCQESRAETVFASAAFQFQGDDEAYLWITNVTDWAVGHSFDDSKHAYDYNNSRPNWTSYLASWTPGSNIRVDDFGKSVRWSGNGPLGDTHSSFATPAVWVVDNLKTEPNGENQGPGIWVWHTGRYRASPIYLSYALKEDVLYPNRYRHFAGFDDMTSENPEEWIPRWRTNESDAVPVIQDFAGEISAVWNHWTEKFNVFYHVNTAGQQGIVMREATFPWGVYGWKRLMVDCRDLDKKVDSLDGYFSGIWEGKGGGCYGGYTHPDLWTCDDEQDILNVRFNISLWNPYKVLLVEAQVPYDGPCE